MDLGVDTHKQAHVRVAIDDQGQTGGTHTMANTPSDGEEGLHSTVAREYTFPARFAAWLTCEAVSLHNTGKYEQNCFT